ncbi:hypothetical protein EMIHUDRAFT_457380 [Emiliania huxleyi CCMP1516]|uniref:protein-serine/threonine phosphatase n=2 Tax=Emiliania huxleyi TaxID=2903 RepID=A0A0D3JRY3_EMIH1|nr:hypothetical protein EMIHUDRAFT_457380 [Emiliania huxleyi CCMP1516]EOD26268.1 hypothetical protein EMIHUDRAFT_457380 [Emiliania huxleyi CCMP1516]|eukprot:XP_005778697.1 hypothetical protein EMIHUDRAFT_457380 [Emiliania huxleyi CCMP1516]
MQPGPKRRAVRRPHRPGAAGVSLGALPAAPAPAAAAAAVEADEEDEWERAWAADAEDGEEEVGYLWGMNIFSYGTYDGVQLSAVEVRRLKDEERAALLASRKLVLGVGGSPSLHWLPRLGLWTKLRPGLHPFLRQLVQRFELYVYTMGARRYAAEVVELLDADGREGLAWP